MTKQQTQDLPVKQASYDVGHCKPPKETQFKPGQSGNPKGPPKHRTQLWVYINQFMEMTDTQLKRQTRKGLTQAQQIALKLVEAAKAGQSCGSEKLARYCIDRELGKAPERIITETEGVIEMNADDRAMLQAIAKEYYRRKQVASVPAMPILESGEPDHD
jgi:hypothetical protein